VFNEHHQKMKVQIHVHGFLKHCVPEQFREPGLQHEFESTFSVFDLLATVLKITTLDATVLVNGRIANMAQYIEDGDCVGVLSPIAGG
jgi:sulfur carrier protein ThiS